MDYRSRLYYVASSKPSYYFAFAGLFRFREILFRESYILFRENEILFRENEIFSRESDIFL